MTNSEKAVSIFESGYNCSQAVLSTFSDRFKLDNRLALRISCGFGGGMARMQETCGAVTGGMMAIGLAASESAKDNQMIKEKAYSTIVEFTKRFKEKHKSIKCRDILKCDMNTEEGRKYINENDLYRTVCNQCVKDAVEILNELISAS
jgi:C_GCAxxG_C_C family probable redox protein